LLNGTLKGESFNGIGSFEMTLHLYRDFELITVLYDSVKHLPSAAILPTTTPIEDILKNISQIRNTVDSGGSSSARSTANGLLRDQLLTLAEPYRSDMLQIVADLVAVI